MTGESCPPEGPVAADVEAACERSEAPGSSITSVWPGVTATGRPPVVTDGGAVADASFPMKSALLPVEGATD